MYNNCVFNRLDTSKGDNDIICYNSLWSVLLTPCCRSTGRKRH